MGTVKPKQTVVTDTRLVSLAVLLILSSLLTACTAKSPQAEAPAPPATLQLTSTAFSDGGSIPVKYTCDGDNVSPPLAWEAPPTGTKSFALICDDPDAPVGIFTHWVIFNIPASVRQLGEAVPATERLEDGAIQGKNSFGKLGYSGPCPPRGSTHRYRFTTYALDKLLELPPGTPKKELLEAMQGHILAQGQLTGTYHR